MKKAAIALLFVAALAVSAFAADVPKLEGPYIVTTCGQSPGAVMIGMSAKQAGVKGDYKTLIVTSGTSMKGMGAAGTNVDAEIDRCAKAIAAAKKAGMTVIGAHVEGMARRTDSSDAASIEAVMKDADVVLVVIDSDNDGFFTKYAETHKKPLIKIKDALAIGPVLK